MQYSLNRLVCSLGIRLAVFVGLVGITIGSIVVCANVVRNTSILERTYQFNECGQVTAED